MPMPKVELKPHFVYVPRPVDENGDIVAPIVYRLDRIGRLDSICLQASRDPQGTPYWLKKEPQHLPLLALQMLYASYSLRTDLGAVPTAADALHEARVMEGDEE